MDAGTMLTRIALQCDAPAVASTCLWVMSHAVCEDMEDVQ